MPEWVRYILAAKWYETTPWDLMSQEGADFFTEAASVISNAQHQASKRER